MNTRPVILTPRILCSIGRMEVAPGANLTTTDRILFSIRRNKGLLLDSSATLRAGPCAQSFRNGLQTSDRAPGHRKCSRVMAEDFIAEFGQRPAAEHLALIRDAKADGGARVAAASGDAHINPRTRRDLCVDLDCTVELPEPRGDPVHRNGLDEVGIGLVLEQGISNAGVARVIEREPIGKESDLGSCGRDSPQTCATRGTLTQIDLAGAAVPVFVPVRE